MCAGPRYGYSRDHGAQFQGQGVGIPLSKAYARFLGGSAVWETLWSGRQAGKGEEEQEAGTGGTRVTIMLPCHGFQF